MPDHQSLPVLVLKITAVFMGVVLAPETQFIMTLFKHLRQINLPHSPPTNNSLGVPVRSQVRHDSLEALRIISEKSTSQISQ